jgi:hypothetical protein
MACPQVVDRGDSLEILKVLHSQDSKQGVVLQLGGLGNGLITPYCIKTSMLQNVKQGLVQALENTVMNIWVP